MWGSALGNQTLNVESVALAPFIRRLHGDVVLWCGSHCTSADAMQGCMVRNTIYLQPSDQGGHAEIPSLSAQLEALPFKSNSLDGVMLHHALEETVDPRVALREVTRVLTPGGRVVISGFNPLSLLGLRRLYARTFQDSLSGHRLINPLRLFDWLTLLGFELDVKPVYCGYGLPFNKLVDKVDIPLLARREKALKPAPMLPFGSVLIVSAIKQAVSLRPQKRTLKERGRLAPVAYPRVASWQRIKP